MYVKSSFTVYLLPYCMKVENTAIECELSETTHRFTTPHGTGLL